MTSRIRIEKDVPISEYYLERFKRESRSQPGRPSKYPFRKMDIGDSFLLPENYRANNRVSDFRGIANTHGSRLNRKFIVLKDDNHELRCWRVE